MSSRISVPAPRILAPDPRPLFSRVEHEGLGGLDQAVEEGLRGRLAIDAHHRLRTRRPHQHPGSVGEDHFQPVSAIDARDLLRIKSVPVAPELAEQALLDGGLERQVEAYGVNRSDLLEQGFDLLPDGEATPRHRLGDQQAGQDSILFRHVTADRQAGALLAAEHDLILLDELPAVLEPYRSLLDTDLVMLR